MKEDGPVSQSVAEEWLKEKKIDAVFVLPTSPDSKVIKLLLNKEKENSTLSQALGGIINSILQETNYQIAGVTPQISLETEFVS